MTRIDEKGRCCGKKPTRYTGPYAIGGPHFSCFRCDRAFDINTGEQIPNWAWRKMESGEFMRTQLGTCGKKPDVVSVTADKNIAPETQRALGDLSRAALRMLPQLARTMRN